MTACARHRPRELNRDFSRFLVGISVVFVRAKFFWIMDKGSFVSAFARIIAPVVLLIPSVPAPDLGFGPIPIPSPATIARPGRFLPRRLRWRGCFDWGNKRIKPPNFCRGNFGVVGGVLPDGTLLGNMAKRMAAPRSLVSKMALSRGGVCGGGDYAGKPIASPPTARLARYDQGDFPRCDWPANLLADRYRRECGRPGNRNCSRPQSNISRGPDRSA